MSNELKPFSANPLFENSDISLFRNDMFDVFANHFNSYFDNLRTQLSSSDSFGKLLSKSSYPKMDIFKSDGKLTMKAAVPGVKPEDVKVEISSDGIVKVSGSSSEENHKQEGASYISKELKMSQFSRSFQLPSNLKDQNPVAEIKDGILTLTWDQVDVKSKENVRVIEVKKT